MLAYLSIHLQWSWTISKLRQYMQCPILTYDKPTKDHQIRKENLHRKRWSKKSKDERKEERKNTKLFKYQYLQIDEKILCPKNKNRMLWKRSNNKKITFEDEKCIYRQVKGKVKKIIQKVEQVKELETKREKYVLKIISYLSIMNMQRKYISLVIVFMS